MLRKKATQPGLASSCCFTTQHTTKSSCWRPLLISRGAVGDAYFDDLIKPSPQPLDFMPPVPYEPLPLPDYSPTFPSGIRFVPVPWTYEKTRAIKKRRFEVSLGAFKMGHDLPYLTAYQEIHEKKAVQEELRRREEEIAEKRKERAFKKSLQGYEAKWKQLWAHTLANTHVPYPDPLPTTGEWERLRKFINDPETYKPYDSLPLQVGVEKFLKDHWTRDVGPLATQFTDVTYNTPGLERRFQPYFHNFAYEPEYPDPWNEWNFESSEIGEDYENEVGQDGAAGNDAQTSPGSYDFDDENDFDDDEVVGTEALGSPTEAYDDEEEEEEEDENGEYADEDEGEGGTDDGEEEEDEEEATEVPMYDNSVWGGNRDVFDIDLEGSRNDPEQLVLDFRALVNAEAQLNKGLRNPRTVAPGMRTLEERQKMKDDKELYQTFYELRTWLYMRKKLVKHGLIPEDPKHQPIRADIVEGIEQAEKDSRDNKKQQQQEESKAKEWLLGDLARSSAVAPNEDAELEKESDELLNKLPNMISTPFEEADADAKRTEDIKRKKILIKQYMRDIIQSERSRVPTENDKVYPLQVFTHYDLDPDVIMGPLARKAFMQRKVIIKVHVPSLGLPKAVVDRLKLLTGPRFNEETQVLSIVAHRHSNKKINKRFAFELLRELIGNALLADPAYVPLSDLSVDIKDVIPRPQLPSALEADIMKLTAPPLLAEEDAGSKKKGEGAAWDYRLFQFNFFSPPAIQRQDRRFREAFAKAF